MVVRNCDSRSYRDDVATRAKSNEVRAYRRAWHGTLSAYRLDATPSGKHLPLSFLNSSLGPFPLSTRLNSFHHSPKCPPSLDPSAHLLRGPSPRSLWLPSRTLRQLSAFRGEPGASRRALCVSYFALQRIQKDVGKLQEKGLVARTQSRSFIGA